MRIEVTFTATNTYRAYTRGLLSAERQYRESGLIKYVWIQDGNVLIRKEDKNKVLKVWSCIHLDQ